MGERLQSKKAKRLNSKTDKRSDSKRSHSKRSNSKKAKKTGPIDTLIDKVNANPNLSNKEANGIIAKIKANKGKIALGLAALAAAGASGYAGYNNWDGTKGIMENVSSWKDKLSTYLPSFLTTDTQQLSLPPETDKVKKVIEQIGQAPSPAPVIENLTLAPSSVPNMSKALVVASPSSVPNMSKALVVASPSSVPNMSKALVVASPSSVTNMSKALVVASPSSVTNMSKALVALPSSVTNIENMASGEANALINNVAKLGDTTQALGDTSMALVPSLQIPLSVNAGNFSDQLGKAKNGIDKLGDITTPNTTNWFNLSMMKGSGIHHKKLTRRRRRF